MYEESTAACPTSVTNSLPPLHQDLLDYFSTVRGRIVSSLQPLLVPHVQHVRGLLDTRLARLTWTSPKLGGTVTEIWQAIRELEVLIGRLVLRPPGQHVGRYVMLIEQILDSLHCKKPTPETILFTSKSIRTKSTTFMLWHKHLELICGD